MIRTIRKLKTASELVREYYPTATPIMVKNHYEIITADGRYLGQGKSKKQAWRAAYNNNVR